MASSNALSKTKLASVIKILTKAYPPAYADSSWDNTGLLIDCSVEISSSKPKLLLTVDLTSAVAQEAIENGCNFILAYHPFIFPSWKRLMPWDNSQHKSAIKLIQNGICVYCPHTSVDAAHNGVNDWLVKSLISDPSQIDSSVAIQAIPPVQGESPDSVGYGRYVKLKAPLPLSNIVKNIKQTLKLHHIQVASDIPLDSKMITTAAVCAGSGSGVFKSLNRNVDLYYSGELSHHEILRYREAGKASILCNHTNTERGYLTDYMCTLLTNAGLDCFVSKTDFDPLYIV